MKNFDFTSLQINKFQQTLDRIYGKGRFLIGCIFLLFGLLFFTSCASEPRDARNGLPTGRQERGHEESRRTPPVAIRIEDTTQEDDMSEDPLRELGYPIVYDAYFAQERDGGYHKIDASCIGNTVYVVVDTFGLAGERVEIQLIDDNNIIAGTIPFQQYINTNADSTMLETFQEDSIQVDSNFTGIVRNIDKGNGESDRRFSIFKLELKATDDATTEEWINRIKRHAGKKMKLCIRVNVPDRDIVIYCGSNYEKIEQRKNDPDNNVWLNQEEKWFEVRELVTIVLDPGHGITNGNVGTQSRIYKYKIKGEDGNEVLDKNKQPQTATANVENLPQYVLDNPTNWIIGNNNNQSLDHDRTESFYVFDLAPIMKALIEKRGYKVLNTRTQRNNVTGYTSTTAITFRVDFANNNNADYFISLHMDGNIVFNTAVSTGSHAIYHNGDTDGQTFSETIMQNYTIIPPRAIHPSARTDIGVVGARNNTKYKTLIETGFATHPNDANTLYLNMEIVAQQLVEGLFIHIDQHF